MQPTINEEAEMMIDIASKFHKTNDVSTFKALAAYKPTMAKSCRKPLAQCIESIWASLSELLSSIPHAIGK